MSFKNNELESSSLAPYVWNAACEVLVIRQSPRPQSQGISVTCKETIRLICEYLDGKLVSSVDRDIKAHLDQCKDCRMVLEAARRTLKIDFDTVPSSSSPQRRSRVA